MVRFGTQGPSVKLQMPDWNAEYKRATPFKQMAGLYGMWAALSPDFRNKIAKLFGGGDDEVLDAPADRTRDEILDEPVNLNTGLLQVMPDGSYSQIGELDYVDDDRPSKHQPKDVIDIDVGATDPWNIGKISTEPAKYPSTLSMAGQSNTDGATPSTLSGRQSKKLTAGGNQNVLDTWLPNNKDARTDLFDPTGYWSLLI